MPNVVVSGSLLIALSAVACASPPPPSAPCDEADPIAAPAWAESVSASPPAAARTVAPRAPQETVRIAPEPEPDPVDQMLGRRARMRIRSLAFHQAPAREALRTLADLGKFNIVIPEGVADRTITVELRDVTLASALRAILAASQLEAVGLGDGIVSVRPLGSK